jgi:mono/diheme cytochrome c family protein
MGCDHLKTEKPTCGNGENALPDDKLLDVHSQSLRSKADTHNDNGLAWFGTVFYVTSMLAILEAYPTFSKGTAHGEPDVFDVYWTKSAEVVVYGAQNATHDGGNSPSVGTASNSVTGEARVTSSVNKGKILYNTPGACVTCHQANGEGLEVAKFPPLAGSEWVTASEEVIVRIVLKGLQGPIKVKGKDYGTVLMAPTIWISWPDEDIAAVINYVRNEWGNKASEVTADTVKRIRAEIADRTTPFTAEELEAFKK